MGLFGNKKDDVAGTLIEKQAEVADYEAGLKMLENTFGVVSSKIEQLEKAADSWKSNFKKHLIYANSNRPTNLVEMKETRREGPVNFDMRPLKKHIQDNGTPILNATERFMHDLRGQATKFPKKEGTVARKRVRKDFAILIRSLKNIRNSWGEFLRAIEKSPDRTISLQEWCKEPLKLVDKLYISVQDNQLKMMRHDIAEGKHAIANLRASL